MANITLTNETKNNLTLTEENRITSPTWDESTMTWDEAEETWDSQGRPIWELETKNNLTLTLETK